MADLSSKASLKNYQFWLASGKAVALAFYTLIATSLSTASSSALLFASKTHSLQARHLKKSSSRLKTEKMVSW